MYVCVDSSRTVLEHQKPIHICVDSAQPNCTRAQQILHAIKLVSQLEEKNPGQPTGIEPRTLLLQLQLL